MNDTSRIRRAARNNSSARGNGVTDRARRVTLDRRREPRRPPRFEPPAIRFAETVVREDEFAAWRRVAYAPSTDGGDGRIRCVDERVLEQRDAVLRLRRSDQPHGAGGTDVFAWYLETHAPADTRVDRTFTAEPVGQLGGLGDRPPESLRRTVERAGQRDAVGAVDDQRCFSAAMCRSSARKLRLQKRRYLCSHASRSRNGLGFKR